MTTKNERTKRLLVLLDSGPLGLLSHPKARTDANECKAWLTALLTAGHSVVIPEITYYETRRELRRVEMKNGTPSAGLANLETLAADMGVVPLTSAVIRLATEFWAEARNKNFAGAPDLALDGDVILCGQARLIDPRNWEAADAEVMVATTNVKHLIHFADARHWRDVQP